MKFWISVRSKLILTLGTFCVLNPPRIQKISYTPGVILIMKYEPFSLVIIPATSVSPSIIVIFAKGIGFPLSSVTLPASLPVVPANNIEVNRTANMSEIMIFLSINNPP